MTEFTQKLGLAIPQVTRGGDVNDVQDIRDTVENILNYIDAGTGDYAVGVCYNTFGGIQTVSGQVLTPLSDIVGTGMGYPEAASSDATPGIRKIGWNDIGGGDYLQINTDASITINKAGNYSVSALIAWTTNDTDGNVYATLQRSDVHWQVNGSHTFKSLAPITGDPLSSVLTNTAPLPTASFVIGPHFYHEGAEVEVNLFVSDAASAIEVQFISLAVERL